MSGYRCAQIQARHGLSRSNAAILNPARDVIDAGSYTVAFKYVPDEVPQMPGFAGAAKVVSPIPEKYSDGSNSGHTATVDADKSKNKFTFDLK